MGCVGCSVGVRNACDVCDVYTVIFAGDACDAIGCVVVLLYCVLWCEMIAM